MARIYCGWDSAYTVVISCNAIFSHDGQLFEEGCSFSSVTYTFTPLQGDPDFTCAIGRSHNTQNWEPLGGMRFTVTGNRTSSVRVGRIDVTYYDTEGNSYNQSTTITQPPSCSPTPTDSYIRFANSAVTAPSRNTYVDARLEYSGCTIDSGTCEVMSAVGDIPITGVTVYKYGSSDNPIYATIFKFENGNLTPDDRSSEVTVRFLDTDGNTYDSTITIYQPADEYIIYHEWGARRPGLTGNWHNADIPIPSEGGVYPDWIVPINTQVCSIQLGTSGFQVNPQLWEGVEKPIISVVGNYLNVNWPANPFEESRDFIYNFTVVWGDDCENSEMYSFSHFQAAKYNPGNKDIEADTTEYNAASGGGDGSTVIQTTGCTYDHFTYITGGSFSVTATSGPNNTIIFTYPENPTTSARTGYVYVTYYDEDGNPYGPQTITFNQQAGSSPGPGPGPEPESGYVLTSLTISDQEQHRYFVEAKPGIVYSAAGQYYKTVLACEARYSLYYVNSYGGVDVLPFKGGGQKKTDNITSYNYSRSFMNNTTEFEEVCYLKEIKGSWLLKTGWLTTEQSLRMKELVESTIVYLYDAEEKTYTPVVMTDKKLEYKTYVNNGKKMIQYDVNVNESQSRERR